MSQNRKMSRKDYKKSGGTSSTGQSKNWLKRIILTFITVILLAVVGGGGLFVYYAASAPELTEEDLVGTFSSELLDENGDVFYTLGGENREYANAGEYPEVMLDAMTAIEDQRFYDHIGIDPIGIARAALGFVTNQGQIVGGGSTITQQLIKLSVFSTLRSDQTLERKAQEAWLAVQLERELSKEQIITLYLNKIHMAGNVYGVATAAEEYYNKPVSELEIHEAALFAGMAKAPNRYNPYVNPELAKDRRDVVINVMRDEGHITPEEAEEAKETPIGEGLVSRDEAERNSIVFDAYLVQVLEEVREKTGLEPATAGLTIETNLNMDAQQRVFDVLNSDDYVDFADEDIQAAVSLVEAETGKVRALGGGRNLEGQLSLNRATQRQTTGSTIKPLTVYGPAIEYLEYSTYHQIIDEEYTVTVPGTTWTPGNYDNQFLGQISLREALVDSRNVPAAKLFNEDLDTDQIENFLNNTGIDPTALNDNSSSLVPQNAINAEMTPLQLAASYAAFANGGEYTEPYTVSAVVTQDGQTIDLTPPTNQAMSEYTAYMVTDILEDVADNYSSTVGIPGVPQAGKTGTTNFTEDDFERYGYPSEGVPDSWYVGYTPNYALSVWVGFDSYADGYLTFNDGTRLLPRHIYQEIMQYVAEGSEVSDWQMPSSVTEVTVEDGTDPAQLPGPNTPESERVTELFVEGTEPTEMSLNYGEELDAPTGLTADYDEEADELSVTWNEYVLENDDEEVSYTLTVNGETVTLTDTQYSLTEPPAGPLTISLSVSAYGTTGPEAFTSLVVVPEQVDEEEEEEIPEENDTEEETSDDPGNADEDLNGEMEQEDDTNTEESPPSDAEEEAPEEEAEPEDSNNENENNTNNSNSNEENDSNSSDDNTNGENDESVE